MLHETKSKTASLCTSNCRLHSPQTDPSFSTLQQHVACSTHSTMFRAHVHSSSVCSTLNRTPVFARTSTVTRTASAPVAQNTLRNEIQRPSSRLAWSLVGGLAAKARSVNSMAAKAAQGDMFPPNQATDEDYEMMAALSSIPSIGSAWAGAAEDPEYDEVSV